MTLTSHPVELEYSAFGDLLLRKNKLIQKMSDYRGLIEPDPEGFREVASNAAFAEWTLAMHYLARGERAESLPNILSAAWCWTHVGNSENATVAVELLMAQCVDESPDVIERMGLERDRIMERLAALPA